MKTKKMQMIQLCALIFFIIRSGYLGIGLSGYIKFGGSNAFLCPLIGSVLGLIPLALFLKIGKLSPDDHINSLLRKSFGKPIGNIISIILFLFVAFYSVVVFWDLNNFIASEYLYNTPILAIVILLVIPIIYLLTKGMQTMSRTSIILSYISLFLFSLSIIGLINKVELSNVFPLLENGIFKVLQGSIVYIAYSVLPIFVILIIPRNQFQQTEKFDKAVLITYGVVSFLLVLATFVVTTVLGVDLANLYQYPDYHVLRRISIGNFIQRVESLLAVQWIISLFVLISICFYYVICSFNYLFAIHSKKGKKISIFIISILLMYASTIIFKNNTMSMNFSIYHFPIFIFLCLFLLPIIIYTWSKKALK